jgi:hypothetical protein
MVSLSGDPLLYVWIVLFGVEEWVKLRVGNHQQSGVRSTDLGRTPNGDSVPRRRRRPRSAQLMVI